MHTRKATDVSCSNIAFIKYWGNHDARLRMPLNDSLSMNLDALRTETTVEFDKDLKQDEVVVGEQSADDKTRARVVEHLGRGREPQTRSARWERGVDGAGIGHRVWRLVCR